MILIYSILICKLDFLNQMFITFLSLIYKVNGLTDISIIEIEL